MLCNLLSLISWHLAIILYSGLILKGEIFTDIFLLTKVPFCQINSITIPSEECLKIVVVEILRIFKSTKP